MELTWHCAMCSKNIPVTYSGRPIFGRSLATAKRELLLKVEDHMDIHCWQFANEMEYGWLEEEQE